MAEPVNTTPRSKQPDKAAGGGGGGVDDELNLDQLKMLKEVFEEADDDGSGELDINEFIEKLGPHLGGNLSRDQITQLFMKIDADAGGTVDWEEFTNYMFLERAQEASGTTNENWRLFPQDFKDRNDPGVSHRGQVDQVFYCEVIDKYVTISRDGSFRLWNGVDLKHFRTVTLGSAWITSGIYMPGARKLVFTSADRSISYYEANRGSYELSGRVYASGTMGVPQSLTLVTNESGEQLVYGDSKGEVNMLLCGTREWPARDLISTDEHQDYLTVHKEHNDWISQVEWVPDIGLVSSSIDSSIKIYDFVREKVINTCNHHQKAVYGFVWCSAYSLFASCGVERDVILWQGNTCRRIGELSGHTASVTHVALDSHLNHVFTLSLDKVIKVWDLRTHRCLQTITQDDWKKTEDTESKPHSLMYDSFHRRVITAVNKPHAWIHKLVAQDRTGHMEPVRGCLYNSTFHVIVTADEGGAVCVWNINNGQREGRFLRAHGDAKLSAICFDKNERRLLTAGSDGTVFMWNFNNGSRLKEFAHGEEKEELTAVLYAADEKRESDAVYAAGWNCKVFVWLEEDNDKVEDYRTFEGHREDITHMAAFPEKQLLATGDYEGRITVWNLFSGEKRMSLFHRAERYETSVERLMWLRPHPCQKDSPLKPDLSACSGLSHRSIRRSNTGAIHAAGAAVAGAASVNGSLKSGSEHEGSTGSDSRGPMLLLSSGGDGMIRVWHIAGTGRLMCTLPGAQGKLEQHGHWRAADQAILALDMVSPHGLIIAGCRDHNVTLWTLDGAVVGILGSLCPERMQMIKNLGALWCTALQDLGSLLAQRAEGEAGMTATGEWSNGNGTSVYESGGDGILSAEDLDTDSMKLASALLAEKRQRQKEQFLTKPMGLHSHLRLHDLKSVPTSTNAKELLSKGFGS
ncbi:WD40-repeat-containing domain protein [Dunaliella salina]|uniref:WD40-repeat-containing domain protein n=1 Tax=Dunaliella salina TaxID=3046 RepID=A0ABQ7GMB6_DUNSA|nr:WD40-repeat-containing domain protein [Dunaliella salina]|eukprot:KAF5835754.1 WD40-repeat-containing domain protein [Dunaliella salina]